MALDFTLAKYAELCEAVLDSGYVPVTVAQHLAQPEQFDRVVLLRHDVDRWVENAVRMAELEYERGIRSTYYFRSTPDVLREGPISKIAGWGHEVGYHYETLAATKGDYERAIRLFETDLARIRQYHEVQTISMHGSPFSRYDNRDLWKKYDYRRFELLGEVYLDVDYARVGYATDTGRSWGASRRNLRDRPDNGSIASLPHFSGTDELVALLRAQSWPHLMLLVHPERWAWSTWTFARSYLADALANSVKLVLPFIRDGVESPS